MLSENRGGYLRPDFSDFEKSEETALEICPPFTLLQKDMKIHLHTVAVQLIQCATTCVPTNAIFPLKVVALLGRRGESDVTTTSGGFKTPEMVPEGPY